LINKILKGEWNFQGAVISDWGAVHNTMQSLLYGNDIEMGTEFTVKKYTKFYTGDTVVALVNSGKVLETVIDEKVRRILRVMYKSGVFTKTSAGEFGSAAHIAIAKKVAEESIVLLKNTDNMLPLNKGNIKSVAVIGANAIRKNSMGGGSSQVKALYEITPFEGLKNAAPGITYNFAQGYTIARNATATAEQINEAVEAAKKSDVAVIVCGWTHGYDYNVWKDNAYDAEDTDKPDMKLPFGQDELIKAVLKANPNTIIVLIGGGPADMTQWIGNTKAILFSGYAGMEGGNAIADVIFGKVNPSGKLTVTFPKLLEEAPAHKLGDFPGKNGIVEYKDDIFVGYRYFDTYKVEPQFAFGHGLSYTGFSYRNLKVSKTASGTVTATFTITNTGKMYGGEVAQLYVHKNNSSITRAEKELKGFQKVFLKAGETKTVSIQLSKEAFQYYDEAKKGWATEKGEYEIHVGGSSNVISLKGKLRL
jgi:beta-glucosidase